jgi:glycosyltransferase involved in cell wall biosynthesis
MSIESSLPSVQSLTAPAINSSSLADTPARKSCKPTEAALRSVIHVINGEHFSGAERVQQHLGKRLLDFGYAPRFACLKPGTFAEHCGLPSETLFDTAMQSRFDLRVVRRLAAYARTHNADLLHAHTPRTALITSLVSRKTRIPWVYHVHSPTSRDSTRGFINKINLLVERWAIRSCDRLITVSRSLRREMLRLGVPRSRLAVVPNGVPALPPIQPATRLNQAGWNIGMIALMRPRKGVEVALESMSHLRQNLNRDDIRLQLIGSFETSDYEQEIRLLESRLCIGASVDWQGFVRNIPQALLNLDALVLPSLFGEGMPMVVLEALAAGVPVVATRVEGTPEVVRHGREGLLAEPRNPRSLAKCVAELTSDRTRWAEYSSQALQRHRESFSEVKMCERIAKVYDQLLSQRPQ